jgi:putative ABC transport system ATP-binding protein
MASPLIALRRVSRVYQMGHVEVPALDDVTLDIADGEFVAIIGPSGSGKSTMMHILGCSTDPPPARTHRRHADRLVDDDGLPDPQPDHRAVFQSYNLLPRTTALDNVATPFH